MVDIVVVGHTAAAADHTDRDYSLVAVVGIDCNLLAVGFPDGNPGYSPAAGHRIDRIRSY